MSRKACRRRAAVKTPHRGAASVGSVARAGKQPDSPQSLQSSPPPQSALQKDPTLAGRGEIQAFWCSCYPALSGCSAGIQRSAASKLPRGHSKKKGGCSPLFSLPLPPLSSLPTGTFVPGSKGGGGEARGRGACKTQTYLCINFALKSSFCSKTNC